MEYGVWSMDGYRVVRRRLVYRVVFESFALLAIGCGWVEFITAFLHHPLPIQRFSYL